MKGNELLNIDGITKNNYDLRVVDILAQIVFQSAPISEIDISDLNKGMYILLINNKPISKFIKK
ncbi:T9SS type A sorting domain-containing protein [Aquimarina celericrescens]|uniref:T9SS type A sorting domain-containing protein n=1 Tax=Aquimarina celericrescens TaxID=1964542 RepID=A0ABW5B2W2_9FLAO|nr:T9SS type A sorting domain-containing protein [Aquimarina celericrescens]